MAGFQGVSVEQEMTTLGRGGSDTTAVDLAAVLDADAARSIPTSPACSPSIPVSCPRPAPLDRVTFEEMLEMAATGGRVLMLRSVEFARNHDVPLHVR